MLSCGSNGHHIVMKKLAARYKDGYIQEIRNRGLTLSNPEAEALFYFQINGCFAVSKRYSGLENEEMRGHGKKLRDTGLNCLELLPEKHNESETCW